VVEKGRIRFENVSFAYPLSEENVLSNITFTVQPGEKLAIIGATGSGKTSLFQLIPRLYEPLKGTIYIDARPTVSYRLEQLRRAIGYVPQNPLCSLVPLKTIFAGEKSRQR